MATYRLNKVAFIRGQLVPAGSEVEFDGLPGANLEPVDAAAKRKRAEADGIREAAARTAEAIQAEKDRSQADALAKAIGEAMKGAFQGLTVASAEKDPGQPKVLPEPSSRSARREAESRAVPGAQDGAGIPERFVQEEKKQHREQG